MAENPSAQQRKARLCIIAIAEMIRKCYGMPCQRQAFHFTINWQLHASARSHAVSVIESV